jgi:hypothetical protein
VPTQVWESDRAAVCARIESAPGFLKILLKTRNDAFFLRRWVRHHGRIVGLENLIIFDNMSDDPEVLGFYERFADSLHVIGFGSHHDDLHDRAKFPDLYDSLARACEYFIFLDTDEFLILCDGVRFHASAAVVRFLMGNRDVDAFPGTWLLNLVGSDTMFRCGTDFARLSEGLVWGKPVIRASAAFGGFINHNGQLDKALFAPRVLTNLFVLHMVQLSARQRVLANHQKLVARKFIAPDESLEAVAARDVADVTDGNVKLYVEEIKRLLPMQEAPIPPPAELPPGSLEFRPDGTVGYHSDTERMLIADYLANADAVVGRLLNLPGRAAEPVEPA